MRRAWPVGPEPVVSAGPAGASEPVLPPPSRRADPRRHQEARTLRCSRHRVTGRLGSRRSTTRTRRAGWEFVHVAIDDTTRLAYVEILDDEKGPTCLSFLRRAIGFFAAHGITVQAVMTDNGTGYRSKVHRAGITELGIKHHRTQPYRPSTNGKAERFIQTLQREWAYNVAYPSSWHRRQALTPWLRYYNCRRPHSALGHKTPASQIS